MEKKTNTFLKIHGHTVPQLRYQEASPEPIKKAARRAPQRPQCSRTGAHGASYVVHNEGRALSTGRAAFIRSSFAIHYHWHIYHINMRHTFFNSLKTLWERP